LAAVALFVAHVAEVVVAQQSEPVVEFIGKAPKLRIYPGGNDGDSDDDGNETWVMLTFGKIEELNAQGGRVSGRAIMSLAAEKGIIWTQENRTVGGAKALVTRMELPLEYGGSFKSACGGGGGSQGGSGSQGGGGSQDGGSETSPNDGGSKKSPGSGGKARRLASPGSVAVEIFVFTSDAMVDYGNYSIPVTRGQLKFNVESKTWPFCGTDHRLEVNLDIKVPGDKEPKKVEEVAEAENEDEEAEAEAEGSGTKKKGGKGGKKPKGKAMKQSAGGRDVNFDLPEVALVDGDSIESEVEVQTQGGKTTIAFRFPYFESTLLYDPTASFDEESAAESTTASTAAPMTMAPSTMAPSTMAPSTTMTTQAPTPQPGSTVISGSLKLSVAEPAAFCANAKVISGLRKAIAHVAKQDVSFVSVDCSVAARRLEGSRRLEGTVEIDYRVTLPPGTTGESAGGSEAALSSISTDDLTTIVNDELKSAGASLEVEVKEKGTVARVTTADDDSAMTSFAALRSHFGMVVTVLLAACLRG